MGLPGFAKFARNMYEQHYRERLSPEEVQSLAQFYGPGYVTTHRPEYGDYVLQCDECGSCGGSSMNREHHIKCSRWVPTHHSYDVRMCCRHSFSHEHFHCRAEDQIMSIMTKLIISIAPKRHMADEIGSSSTKKSRHHDCDETEDEFDDKTQSSNSRKRHTRDKIEGSTQKRGRQSSFGDAIGPPVDFDDTTTSDNPLKRHTFETIEGPSRKRALVEVF